MANRFDLALGKEEPEKAVEETKEVVTRDMLLTTDMVAGMPVWRLRVLRPGEPELVLYVDSVSTGYDTYGTTTYHIEARTNTKPSPRNFINGIGDTF